MDSSEVGSESSPSRQLSARGDPPPDVRSRHVAATSSIYMKPVGRGTTTAWGATPSKIHKGPKSVAADKEDVASTRRLRASSEVPPVAEDDGALQPARQRYQQDTTTGTHFSQQLTPRNYNDDGGEASQKEDYSAAEVERPELTQEELHELQTRLEQALAEQAVLKEGYNYEKSATAKLSTKVKQQEDAYRLLDSDSKRLAQRVRVLEEKRKKLEEEAHTASTAEDQLVIRNAEYQKLRKEYNVLEQQVKQHEASKATGKRKLEATLKHQREVQKKKSTVSYEKKITALTEEIEEMKVQRNDLVSGTQSAAVIRQRKNAEIAAELSAMEADLKEKHRLELQELQRSIQDQEREAQRAVDSHSSHETSAKNEFQSKWVSLELSRQAKAGDLNELKAKMESRKKELSQVEAALDHKKRELDQLFTRMEDQERKTKGEEAEIQRLQRRIEKTLQDNSNDKRLEVHAAAWEREKKDMQQNLVSEDNRIKALQKEKETLQSKLNTAKEEKEQKTRSLQAAEKESTNSEKGLAAKKAELQKLKSKLATLQEEYEDAKGVAAASQKDEIISRLENEERTAKVDVEGVQKSNAELSQRISKYEKALQAAGLSMS